MNADLDRISEQIIGAAFEVGNTLGAGFLEKVYENALVHELKKRDLLVEQQKRVTIYYDGVVVGDYWGGENPPEFERYFQPKSSLHFFTENGPVLTVNPHAFGGNPA